MKLGLFLRNYGAASTVETMLACALRAEAAGIDQIWVADHVAIPPDDAAGSGGRYVDPLITLAYLAGQTDRIGLGTGVLVLPHRNALATAKSVASLQELTCGRLLFGVGVGAMRAEFRVSGVPFDRRGAVADEVLEMFYKCFEADEVEENGQRFLFLPRPARPPVFVGGAGPHVVRRIVRYGDGWIAPRSDPAELREQVPALQDAMREARRDRAQIIPLAALPMDDTTATVERVQALREIGVDGLVCLERYENESGFARWLEFLVTHVRPSM